MEMLSTQDFEYLRGLNLSHQVDKNIVNAFVVRMDQNRWREVEKCKELFLAEGVDPHQLPYMYPEVADSWIRSKNAGVDPYQRKLGKNLKPREYRALVQDKKVLMDITYEFINKNIDLLTASNYHMALTDENGILLFSAGEKKRIERFEAINAVPGAIWTEELIGTNCHSLCIKLRKPVQLIGPYYYCDAVTDNIGSATPIMDENNNLLGVLLVIGVATPKKRVPKANLLNWVIAAGLAIESQLRLRKQSYYLGLANKTLKSTMEVIGEGCIILDWRTNIAYINREAAEIFNVKDKDALGKPFSKLCKADLPIEDVLEQGKPVNKFEINIGSSKTPRFCEVDIEPLANENKTGLNGVFLRIRDIVANTRSTPPQGAVKQEDGFATILGDSKALKVVVQNVRNVSQYEDGILLIGESGTGKELFARAIHEESRPEGPFIPINCASIPRTLFESELFGYEGGAFTGAERRGKVGKIELAHGGTLFLDEIGELPLELQPVLLRVLENKHIMRVGGTKYIPVDFRVVAATNKDLWKMVQNKEFREDLYFRLAVFKFTIPPLRDRANDVIKLAETFIAQKCSEEGRRKIPALSPEVRDLFLKYDWPGNVRQLKNVISYSLAMVTGNTIKTNHLPEELLEFGRSKKPAPGNEESKPRD